jgi:hypothetical protein
MKIANDNVCKAAICRSCLEIDRAFVRDDITHWEIAMKLKKIVSGLLTVTLIYGALTLIIVGGFALSMGFAMAATPNAPNLPEVQKGNPTTISLGHAQFTAVADIDTSTPGK